MWLEDEQVAREEKQLERHGGWVLHVLSWKGISKYQEDGTVIGASPSSEGLDETERDNGQKDVGS